PPLLRLLLSWMRRCALLAGGGGAAHGPWRPDAALPTACAGVYAGHLEDAEWRQLLQKVGSRPPLSISERRELCRIGCMFCLEVRQDGVGFESNLDSVARSGVHVNPRVLQLSRRKAGP
ncbi:YfiR family protein, partial [Paracidovorax cattleyae]|uniref:YfiR family protein n=2 Tax=Paracidovorax cattleyae TaxID=80868 RepID=UPI001E4DB3A1